MDKEIDCSSTDTVICPYCGYDNGGDDGDGPPTGPQECYSCEKKFECEPDYSVYYSTFKVDCWNGEPHDWRKPDFLPGETKTITSCRACRKSKWVDLSSDPAAGTPPAQ